MKLSDRLYAYQCIKNEPSSFFFGLGKKKYKKGDYVSYSGEPVKELKKATVSMLEDYDFLNIEDCECENLREYFKSIEFKIVKKNE